MKRWRISPWDFVCGEVYHTTARGASARKRSDRNGRAALPPGIDDIDDADDIDDPRTEV